MSIYVLENEKLKVAIDSRGAEIKSVVGGKENREYMWQGDPAYWGRTAPILFPLVGNFKDKRYRYEGHTYTMGQHGFARDREFTLVSRSADTLEFMLTEDEDSLKIYPFPFQLTARYEARENEIKVIWKVENTGARTLYFSIGAHPGFLCPLSAAEKQSDYYLKFDTDKELLYHQINGKGEVAHYNLSLPLEKDGSLRIPENLFANDALIVEGKQAREVSLLTPDKEAYVTALFDAPLFGLWSPAGKAAPFVCIEPWYGRSDADTFDGSLEERKYGNTLPAGEVFEKWYTIRFDKEA